MKRLLSRYLGVVVAAFVVAGMATAPAEAGTEPASASVSTAATAAAKNGFSMRDRFAREVVRHGQSDRSVRRIAHVRELQYRLRWAGTFHAGATGYFGDLTRAAVRRYQHREGLKASGVATHATWAHLLRDTIRHRGAIPRVCRRAGWHACYDRSMHQVVLMHNGRAVNTWLVRGGSSRTPTRLGTNAVYYRDKDHVSSLFGSPMPYSQFFDGGQALHGSASMMNPFSGHSHGCINMYIEDARQLWNLTSGKRLVVTVYGRWS